MISKIELINQMQSVENKHVLAAVEELRRCGKMRDELLDREIFFTLEEAKTLIARWREEYNHIRPHGALCYRFPAPQAWLLVQQTVIAPGLP